MIKKGIIPKTKVPQTKKEPLPSSIVINSKPRPLPIPKKPTSTHNTPLYKNIIIFLLNRTKRILDKRLADQQQNKVNRGNRKVLTVPAGETKVSSSPRLFQHQHQQREESPPPPPLQQLLQQPEPESYFGKDREMLFRPIKYDVDEQLGEQVVNNLFGDDFNDLEDISSDDDDDDDDILIIPPEVFILYSKNKKKKYFLKWKMYHNKVKAVRMKKQREIEKIEEMKMSKAFQFYSKRESKKLFRLWRKLVLYI